MALRASRSYSVGAVVGGLVGGFVPSLWGGSDFSMTAVLTSLVGGLIGVTVAYFISNR